MPAQYQDIAFQPGDDYDFGAKLGANDDGSAPDVASAVWNMARTQGDLGSKDVVDKNCTIQPQQDNSVDLLVHLDTADTRALSPGTYFHRFVVTEQSGRVTTVTIGRVFLGSIQVHRTITLDGKKYTTLNDVPLNRFDAPVMQMRDVTPDPNVDLPQGTARGLWSDAGVTVDLIMFDGSELDGVALAVGMNKIIVARVKAIYPSGAKVRAVY